MLEVWKNSRSTYKDLRKRGELTRVDQKARYSGQQGLQAMQDLDILSTKGLFLFWTLLKISRQGISSPLSLAWTIFNLKVITREFLGQADLSGGQTLCVHELAEVIVVGEYKQFMLRHF